MKKKTILFLSPLPPPHYGSAMSSEMCLNILREATFRQSKSKMFEVHNIKLNYSKSMDDIGKLNFAKIRGIFHVKRKIKEAIRSLNPDIVYFMPATYSFGLYRDWLFVREVTKQWNKKIIFHVRSRILDRTWNSFLGRIILRQEYSGNKAIVLGKELLEDLRGLVPQDNISLLPNAIKNEISQEKLEEIIGERRKKQPFKILFLSNMDRTKGWPKVLEACKILHREKFHFICDFVGSWLNKQDEAYFAHFVQTNGLQGRVFAHGRKIGEQKARFLEEANVLIFPTEYKLETFGRVILEAYMYAVPVIANGVATIPTTVENGKTGFVLKANKGSEIAHKILSENNWETMGRQGRTKFLKEFEVDKYVDNFINIINHI